MGNVIEGQSHRESHLQQVEERLSALADGELSDAELSLLLSEISRLSEHDQQRTMQKWQNYHLTQSALHGGSCSSSFDIAGQVMADLTQEAPLQSSGQSGKASDAVVPDIRNRGQRSVYHQWAVAASVCFAVVLSWQLLTAVPPNDPSAPLQDAQVATSGQTNSLNRQNLTNPQPQETVVSRAPLLSGSAAPTVVSTRPVETKAALPEAIPVVDAAQWAAPDQPLLEVDEAPEPISDDQRMSEYVIRHGSNARLVSPLMGPESMLKVTRAVNNINDQE
jgi:hypothetical protein